MAPAQGKSELYLLLDKVCIGLVSVYVYNFFCSILKNKAIIFFLILLCPFNSIEFYLFDILSNFDHDLSHHQYLLKLCH